MIPGRLLTRWVGYWQWLQRAVRAPARRACQAGRLGIRARVLLGVLVTGVVVTAPTLAFAADGGSSQLAALLQAFAVTDSHGLTITDYELSLDNGGWVGKTTGQGISHWLLVTTWDMYRVMVAVAVWLLDVATGFTWLELVREPLEVVSTALQAVIDDTGVVPVFLTLAAVISGGWLLRGRHGAAVGEVAIAVVLATLLGGVLSNPVAVMTGPNGGISVARDLGTELSATVVAGRSATPAVWEVPDQPAPERAPAAGGVEHAQSVVAGRIVELFVRTPHQLINYGAELDRADPSCVQVYDEALAGGPYEDDAQVRERVGGCHENYAAAAADPGAGLVTVLFVAPSGSFLVLLMVVLTLCLLLASLLALWEATRLVVEMLKGILPGDLRSGIWECVCSAVTALAMIVGVLLGIGVYLRVMSALFASDWSAWQMFIFVDMLMLLAAIVMITSAGKIRRRGRRLGQKLAARTSPRPVTTRQPSNVPQLVSSAVHMAAAGTQMVRRTGSHQSGGRGAPSRERPETATDTRRGAVRAGAGLALSAGKVALASTVGLPVYGPRAATAVRTAAQARRSALQQRLSTAHASGRAKVKGRAQAAQGFGREYAHNVGVAARFAGKVSGATHLAGVAVDAGVAPGVSAVLAAGAVTGRDAVVGRRPPAAHAPATSGPSPASPSRPRRQSPGHGPGPANIAPLVGAPVTPARTRQKKELRDRLAKASRRHR